MKIGSWIWRLLNYGPRATLFYILQRNRKSLKVNSQQIHPIKDFNSLDNILELSPGSALLNSREIISEMATYDNLLRGCSPDIMLKPILGDDLSINRLLLIRLIIMSKDFDYFVETGTQHGLSSYIAANTFRKIGLSNRTLSFDVAESVRLDHPEVKYEILKFPVRRNFTHQLHTFKNFKNLIFFHDSDHSYENMTFEFEASWRMPNVGCVISDDVEPNSAFQNFCLKHEIRPHYLKIDNGPTAGFVFR